jgi:HEPN domain-containing protein
MLPTTREWVLKAEGDYDVVLLLLRSRKPTRHDPICFHVQQCIEKYLKARLTEAGTAFAKTHDLVKLLNLALTVEPHLVGIFKFVQCPEPLRSSSAISGHVGDRCRRARSSSRMSAVSKVGAG